MVSKPIERRFGRWWRISVRVYLSSLEPVRGAPSPSPTVDNNTVGFNFENGFEEKVICWIQGPAPEAVILERWRRVEG